jgi:hypothetical protein
MHKLRVLLLGLLAAAVAGFMGPQTAAANSVGLPLTPPSWQGQSQGHGHGHGRGAEQEGEQGENHHKGHGKPSFRTEDRRLISQYFAGQWGNLPPGLAKRGGNLPPGLEKQLERNGHLPPGLQKRFQPFPPELEERLPPLPPDYTRGFIGASIVIYDRRTALIVDIVHDVIALTH